MHEASYPDRPDVDAFRAGWGKIDRLTRLVAVTLDSVSSESLVARSRETPTHYKWLLAVDPSGTRVWLHEFKPADERRSGYVEAIHCHRYSFTAILLSGCYRNRIVDIAFDDRTLEIRSLHDRRLVEVGPGASYTMTPDDFHGLVGLEDGTSSVVIESAPERRRSYSVNGAGTHMVCHVPLEERVDELRVRRWAEARSRAA